MSSEVFFKTLKRLGIRKSDKCYENIEDNFNVHKNLKGQIAVDKIQKYLSNLKASNGL